MDGQDWALLRACLAPNVHVDYSDLRGDPPATIAADDFVAARVTGLRGLPKARVGHDRVGRRSDD